MGFWDKSLQIVHCLCDNAPQSVRHIHQTFPRASKLASARLPAARPSRKSPDTEYTWVRLHSA